LLSSKSFLDGKPEQRGANNHGRTDKFTAQILSFSQHVRGGLAFSNSKAPDITGLDDHQKAISIFYRTAIISNITSLRYPNQRFHHTNSRCRPQLTIYPSWLPKTI